MSRIPALAWDRRQALRLRAPRGEATRIQRSQEEQSRCVTCSQRPHWHRPSEKRQSLLRDHLGGTHARSIFICSPGPSSSLLAALSRVCAFPAGAIRKFPRDEKTRLAKVAKSPSGAYMHRPFTFNNFAVVFALLFPQRKMLSPETKAKNCLSAKDGFDASNHEQPRKDHHRERRFDRDRRWNLKPFVEEGSTCSRIPGGLPGWM